MAYDKASHEHNYVCTVCGEPLLGSGFSPREVLYCYKNLPIAFSKGKFYYIDNYGRITTDQARLNPTYESYEDLIARNPSYVGHLARIVHRPAKNGEQILTLQQDRIGDPPRYQKHQVLLCTNDYANKPGTMWYGVAVGYDNSEFVIRNEFYSVIEGYITHAKRYLIHDYTTQKLGDLGKISLHKDALGRQLFVGDVVELWHDGVFVRDTVVLDHGHIRNMGWPELDKLKDPNYPDKILKKRHWDDIPTTTIIDGVKYVMEHD